MEEISELEASRRRRLINHSLKGVLSEQEVLQAIDIWEKNFYNSPVFRIPSFIAKAQNGLNLTDETKRVLIKNLNSNLSSPLAALGPDPLQKQAQVATKNDQPLAGEYVVFNSLLLTLINSLDPSGIQSLQDYLINSLPNNSSSIVNQTLTDWGKSINTDQVMEITSGLNPTYMSEILDILYNFFCEILGPMSADRFFAEAIRGAENLPEARGFPPKQLF